MTLTAMSELVGIPIDILKRKCVVYNKNPDGKFTALDFDFFSSYFNLRENQIVISSKINFY